MIYDLQFTVKRPEQQALELDPPFIARNTGVCNALACRPSIESSMRTLWLVPDKGLVALDHPILLGHGSAERFMLHALRRDAKPVCGGSHGIDQRDRATDVKHRISCSTVQHFRNIEALVARHAA